MRIWMVCVMAAACGDSKPGKQIDAPDQPPLDAALTPLQAWGLAWSEYDTAKRDALLEIALDTNIRYVSRDNEWSGRSAISSTIGYFLGTGGSTDITTNVDQHQSRARYGWYVKDAGGTTTATGRDVDALAADGRLVRVVEFWDPLPSPGSLTTVQQAFLDAFNTTDGTQRDTLLATAVTNDVLALMPPSTRGTTRAELSTIIASDLAAEPGRTLGFTSGVLANREFWYVTWERQVSAVATGNGVLAVVLATDGTIREAVFFNGPL